MEEDDRWNDPRWLANPFDETPEESALWKSKAACRGLPVELFFGNHNQGARQVCKDCSVIEECFNYTEKFEQAIGRRNGFSGNTSAAEREARNPLPPWTDYKSSAKRRDSIE